VGRFYSSNAEDAEWIRAIVLFDEVSDDDSIDDGTECDGNYVELGEVTRRVQKKLRRKIIAAMKWTLLTAVVIGKDKPKWGKVKSSTHISAQMAKYYEKLPRVTGQDGMTIRPSKRGTVSLQMYFR